MLEKVGNARLFGGFEAAADADHSQNGEAIQAGHGDGEEAEAGIEPGQTIV